MPEEFATLILNFISRNCIGPRGIEVGMHTLLPDIINYVVSVRMILLLHRLMLVQVHQNPVGCSALEIKNFVTFKASHM